MTTLEIRQHLINSINETEAPATSFGVLHLPAFQLSDNNDSLCTENQRASIALSIQQIIERKIYSAGNAEKLTGKWMPK